MDEKKAPTGTKNGATREFQTRVRLNRAYSEAARLKIRTGMVINRLQRCLAGDLTMTAQQVRIAFGLLAKTLPDLTRTEHVGDGGGPVETKQIPATPDEAAAMYMDMLRAPKVKTPEQLEDDGASMH